MVARQILALVLLTIFGPIFGQTPIQVVTLSSIQDINHTELQYTYTKLDACQLLFLDEGGETIKNDWTVSSLLTFTSINDKERPRNKLRAIGNHKKGAFRAVELDDYVIAMMRYKSDGKFVPTGMSDDLALWQKTPKGYRLIKIYPDYVGGCLYCRVTLLEHHGNTIAFEVGGTDAGDIWGSRMYFSAHGEQIDLRRKEYLSGYENIDYMPSNSVYPHNIKYNMVIKGMDYDLTGNIIGRDVTVETLDAEGNPIMFAFEQDSLDLTPIPFLDGTSPRDFFTIPVKGKSLHVGSLRGNYVPVKWKGIWYQAKWEDVRR